MTGNNFKIQSKKLSVYYDSSKALKSVDLDIRKNSVTALIGPSGCGKTTYLRCLNRMNDIILGARVEGEIRRGIQYTFNSLFP